MTFVADVRNELVRLPLGKSCCMLAEIAALTQTTGSLSLQGFGHMRVSWRTESAGLARRLFQLLRARLGLTARVHYVLEKRLGQKRICILTLDDAPTEKLLLALGMMETGADGRPALRRIAPRFPITRQCCSRAFLRGAFLGGGTMAAPEKSYHLEWTAPEASLRQTLSRILEKNALPVQEYTRRGKNVLYLKEAQQVADCLALMGASGAVLKLENIRIRRQMRGRANRVANCDGHNADRTAEACARQTEAIRQIALRDGLSSLPPSLESVARLRLEHPGISLFELGQMLSPPLGKSGISHRMQKLMLLADSYPKEDVP